MARIRVDFQIRQEDGFGACVPVSHDTYYLLDRFFVKPDGSIWIRSDVWAQAGCPVGPEEEHEDMGWWVNLTRLAEQNDWPLPTYEVVGDSRTICLQVPNGYLPRPRPRHRREER